MEFKTIKKNHKNKVILGGLISLGIASALICLPSRAKYRTTESFNIVNGTINYKVPDFNIVAMYSSEDGNNYTELTERMPSSGYAINESRSYCNLNGIKDTSVKLYTENAKHNFGNLQKGNKCYLYFDKVKITNSASLIANSKINTYSPDFSQVAITDEGIYQIPDGMYGGTSYYWRGAATTNYLKFANFCWRIVRINGDGSIRIIYDGESCHENGETTADSIPIKNIAYNTNSLRSENAGYTYIEGEQRPANNSDATSSNLKEQNEIWYNEHLVNFTNKIADGRFCNDRDVAIENNWNSQPNSIFYYAAYDRTGERNINNVLPTLSCTNIDDIYTLKIGAIIVDEMIIAGAKFGETNKLFYLFNGQYYWTMTPYYWMGKNITVYRVNNDGYIGHNFTHMTTPGIRPVINLKADTVFSSGDGTIDSPYTVQ